jgi:uncharacterized membrane protein
MMSYMRNDVLMLLASLSLLVGYHLFLCLKVRQNPYYTFRAVMASSRAAWTHAIMDGGKDILAVQTLRNSTMAATFMASTAIFLITGLLTLSTQGDKLESTWHALNFTGGSGPELWLLKILVMLIDLFIGFFSFSMSIRYFHHVGYMINVPSSGKYGKASPDLVIAQLERAGQFYWVGMRSYFLLVPLVLWFFGPHFMLAATVALVGVLFMLDHMPADEEQIAEKEVRLQNEPVVTLTQTAKKSHLVSVG